MGTWFQGMGSMMGWGAGADPPRHFLERDGAVNPGILRCLSHETDFLFEGCP